MGLSDKVKLDGAIPRAVQTLNEMANPKYVKLDQAIPRKLLQNCKGIAFITVYKAGLFMIGGQVGGGFVITKIPDESSPDGFRWSAPLGVSVAGLQGGFIFGGEKISSVIILNTPGSIRGFAGKGQVSLSGSLSLAAGPTGRDISAGVGVSNTKEVVPAYSYSIAKGAYIGATLDGAILKVNQEDNAKFYGIPDVTSDAILSGEVRPPLSVTHLYECIQECSGPVSVVDGSHQGGSKLGNSGKQLLNESLGDGPLPPGWQLLHTPEGKPYYFDGTNTTWEKPAAVVPPRPTPPPPPPAPPAATSLPSGWEALTTDDGKTYYLNKVTNVTQWEKP